MKTEMRTNRISLKLTWFCDVCGEAIADGEGHLAIDCIAAMHTTGTWGIRHDSCDGNVCAGTYYCVPVRHVRTEEQLLLWTAELMGERSWFGRSDWPQLIRKVHRWSRLG